MRTFARPEDERCVLFFCTDAGQAEVLLGDATYGTGFKTKATQLSPQAREALEGLGRQALHAYLLAVQHPTSGDVLEFRSELPVELARLHHRLSRD